MAPQDGDLAAGGHIPNPRGVVPTPCQHLLPVGGKSCGLNRRRMPVQPSQFVACGDIPQHRGTAWADYPVDGADIDAALAGAGLTVESGDALLLDMGRDRFEAAAGHVLGGPETDQDAGGGLSADGARWVAEHPVSILAWDMLDSRDAKASHATAHILTWAIGLPLLDNCDFAALRRALGDGTQVAGALVVAPLAVEGANGVNLNPLVLR